LPEDVKESIRRGGLKAAERGLRKLLASPEGWIRMNVRSLPMKIEFADKKNSLEYS